MLLDQSQSPLWTQPTYFFAVVAAQQNTQVNKLVRKKKWKKDKHVILSVNRKVIFSKSKDEPYLLVINLKSLQQFG